MIRVDRIFIIPAAWFSAALFILPVYADSPAQAGSISVVSISGTTDSDDGSDYCLDANVALPEQRRLILSLGQLFIKSTETGRVIEPLTGLIGLETDSEAKIPLGVELEYWDDQESINVKTLRGTLGYRFDKVDITFKPQFREFNFNAKVTRESSSEGFSVNIGAQMLGNVYVYGEYGKHYYSQILLDFADLILGFDYARLKLVNSVGFSDYIYTLGGSVYLAWGGLSGYWIHSVSAVDQSNTYSYGATVDIDILRDFSLGISLGTQTTEQEYADFVYGTLALSYYW